MTERERVLAILNHEKPDQLPWLADLTYWMSALETNGKLPAGFGDWNTNGNLQKVHENMGIGFYLQGYEPFRKEYKNVNIREERNGNVMVITYETPVGNIRQIQEYSPVSYSWGYKEHFIKDIEDLKVYTYICENTTYHPDYELAKRRYQYIGDKGVVLCYTPKSPLMDQVALYAGVENVTYMALDEEEEFAALLDRIEEKYDEACRLVIDSPAECIMIPENISSECVASFYQDYMKRYHKKWTDQIRAAGKYSFVHQDGTVRGLITQLSKESGFDVIEAVTPKPMGDVSIDEVASLVDYKTIIWGGIPGGMFVESVLSDAEFDAHVKHVIEVMTSDPRYVLGVADQVVPGSSARRIKRVRELVNEFGVFK